MSKHTPGPWEVGPDHGYDGIKGTQVWDCETDYVLALAIGDVDDLPHAANASLIATAPELLGAVKILADFAENAASQDYNEDRVLSWLAVVTAQARALIAKAEGAA